ncbi:hypothetical protein H0H87_002340 [Tephrocybe sp. NHM501043]|nr:hypothetical protein H0H87_002340 [Tephrocybe sp. NHM501043]
MSLHIVADEWQIHVVIIDLLFSYENEGSTVGYPPSPSSWSIAGIETWLIDQTADLLSGSGFNPTADLFDQGFDSLYATSLRLRVIHALRTLEDDKCQGLSHRILPDLVYAFPVIKDLARFVSSLLTSEAVQGPVSRGANAIEAMIAKYTFGLATSPEAPLAQLVAPTPATVLLTGSTGNLGSQILARLLEDPRVSKVYAYNRPPKAGTKTLLDRHIERFEEAGLDAALLRMEKLVLIAGNATESYLGLDRGIYSQLCKTVNVVIHNAWRLDFNLSLASFEPNIQGMRHFIDLALSGPNPSDTRFLFISSIAAIQNWDKSKGPVPEDVVEDVNVALGGGYGEAKHVCERILLHSGLKGVSIRPGQICGGRPNGTWPTTEWLPILVKSSVSLRAIPDTSGLASWLGGDTISAIIVDVALSTYSAPLPSAFNLIHPRPVEQSAIIKGIIKGIAEVLGHELKLVPFNEWIAMVEERFKNANSETWATVPAVKLLEFFRNYAREDSANVASVSQRDAGGLPSLSTEKVQRESVFMHPQRLKQIGDDDTKLWVSYWHATGYLT